MTRHPPPSAPDANEQQQPHKRRSAFWRELAVLLAVAVLVAVVVRTFLLQTFYIPSGSMENTLQRNDKVLVNKLIYDFRGPHRGEIVVFTAPESWRSVPTEKDFIKRVIGIGGDHVVCCDSQHRITVNGKALDEPYLYRSPQGRVDRASADRFDITVPKGRLWVMGDHRSHSGDSRAHYVNDGNNIEGATIPESQVIGRAFAQYWPPSRAKFLSVPKTFDAVPDPPKP